MLPGDHTKLLQPTPGPECDDRCRAGMERVEFSHGQAVAGVLFVWDSILWFFLFLIDMTKIHGAPYYFTSHCSIWIYHPRIVDTRPH